MAAFSVRKIPSFTSRLPSRSKVQAGRLAGLITQHRHAELQVVVDPLLHVGQRVVFGEDFDADERRRS